MANIDDDLVIQIEITSNRGRVGKTALAIKLARALKNILPEVEIVIEDDGHCVRERMIHNVHGEIIANKIRIVDNPPHDEATYRRPIHDTDVVTMLKSPDRVDK